jgi:predicted ATPase
MAATEKTDTRTHSKIAYVEIQGFRSLEDASVTLGDLNVIIGANGSGKSNFIKFFEMLSEMLAKRNLGGFVEQNGGADDQLFGGNKKTPRMSAEIHLRTSKNDRNDYRFSLTYGEPDRLFFTEEKFRFSNANRKTLADWQSLESGHREAEIVNKRLDEDKAATTAKILVGLLRNCSTYQFHDTSTGSPFKTTCEADDVNNLRRDGGNLAAVLFWLRDNDGNRYEMIRRQIARILPVFDDFELEPRFGKIALRWRSKALPHKTMGAHLTSDGSLRLFALVTLLNLPPEMLPDVIMLDEPELGLHPAGIVLIGSMIRSVSSEKQVIVATQSPLLVNSFEIDEVIVAECRDGRSSFTPKKSADYQEWLEDDFKAGDLWLKNLLGGRP